MNDSSLQVLRTLTPRTFTPSVLRNLGAGSPAAFDSYSQSDLGGDKPEQSFRYDLQGLKSTQQLNVDWTSFANHVFFQSAQVKVNSAFSKISNFYPFDGTKSEIVGFVDKLTGWEKSVFDRIPKHKGFLHFLGAGNGTFVKVKDLVGSDYAELVRDNTARNVLNPRNGKSLTVECWLQLPEIGRAHV